LERVGEGDAMVLAEHNLRGGEKARAVGFFLRAAQQALLGEDLDAATARAERGLACGARGEDEGALLAVWGEATTWKGDIAAAGANSGEVTGKATPGSGPWYWALTGRGVHATLLGQIDRLAATVTLALATQPVGDGAAALVGLIGALAWILCGSG